MTNHVELGARTAEDPIVERDVASIRRGVAHLPRGRHLDGVVAPVEVQALDAVPVATTREIEAVALAELERVAHVRWTEPRITVDRRYRPRHPALSPLEQRRAGAKSPAEGDFLSEFQGGFDAVPRGQSDFVARSRAVDDDPGQLAVVEVLRKDEFEARTEAL